MRKAVQGKFRGGIDAVLGQGDAAENSQSMCKKEMFPVAVKKFIIFLLLSVEIVSAVFGMLLPRAVHFCSQFVLIPELLISGEHPDGLIVKPAWGYIKPDSKRMH